VRPVVAAFRAMQVARSARQVRVAARSNSIGQFTSRDHADVDAFRIGSAAFAGSLQPEAGVLTTQLRTVVSRWLASPTHMTADKNEASAPSAPQPVAVRIADGVRELLHGSIASSTIPVEDFRAGLRRHFAETLDVMRADRPSIETWAVIAQQWTGSANARERG
jgi:hypothetical protein